MAAAKKPDLRAAVMGGTEDSEFSDYAPPDPMGDPEAAADDEALFQDTLAQFFPGMTEEEYLQFHRVANAKLGE